MAHFESELEPIDREILAAISNRLKARIGAEIAPKVQKLLAEAIEEEVAKVTIEVSRWVTFERIGQELRIVIRKPEPGR